MHGFWNWLSKRTPSREIATFLRAKRVPAHRYDRWYLFGGLTLLFFGIQVASGILLTLYYQPTPETAHESVGVIMSSVSYGWLIRGIHKWASHLLIFSAIVHMASKYFFRAYRAPRELTWTSGVLLILILLGFAFTGHLLPWDTTGYFATQIGTEIPRSTPLIGTFLTELLRGSGEYVDSTALTRMYSLHTVILPLISFLLIGFHIILNQFTGSASPAGIKTAHSNPFYPDFVLRDAFTWICGVGLLFTLVLLIPTDLGPKADILASTPPGIHPEWYFLPLFQTIRFLPGTVAGFPTELIINLFVGILVAGLFFIPWFDRATGGNTRVGWMFLQVMGVFIILYGCVTILWTYIA